MHHGTVRRWLPFVSPACDDCAVTTLRLIAPADAAELAELVLANRTFLAPWDPVRPDDYFTVEGQQVAISGVLRQHEQGLSLPCVILDEARIVGRITLNGITRGPLQSCSVGYWVSAADNGRGIATAAVRSVAWIAFDDVKLHRIQAETLPHNAASQRVLERNGFVRYGYAPKYLHIAGEWRDHVMFQLLAPEGDR